MCRNSFYFTACSYILKRRAVSNAAHIGSIALLVLIVHVNLLVAFFGVILQRQLAVFFGDLKLIFLSAWRIYK